MIEGKNRLAFEIFFKLFLLVKLRWNSEIVAKVSQGQMSRVGLESSA